MSDPACNQFAEYCVAAFEAADPASVYRRYLAAIAQRDVVAVLGVMTDDYARPLHELHCDRDFGPFFELWCESQMTLAILSSRIEGDCACVETSDGNTRRMVRMRRTGGRWRIDGEAP